MELVDIVNQTAGADAVLLHSVHDFLKKVCMLLKLFIDLNFDFTDAFSQIADSEELLFVKMIYAALFIGNLLPDLSYAVGCGIKLSPAAFNSGDGGTVCNLYAVYRFLEFLGILPEFLTGDTGFEPGFCGNCG